MTEQALGNFVSADGDRAAPRCGRHSALLGPGDRERAFRGDVCGHQSAADRQDALRRQGRTPRALLVDLDRLSKGVRTYPALTPYFVGPRRAIVLVCRPGETSIRPRHLHDAP